MRVVVLADTHLRRSWANRQLPPEVVTAVASADVVLHAGDVVEGHVLDDLRSKATVHAVLGNNDVELVGRLPETIEVDLDGVRVGMIHDSGPSAGRAARLHRRFPTADIVIFGHSHEPMCAPGEGDQLLFNPGSPTERRRQPRPSYGMLEIEAGKVTRAEILLL